MFISNIIISLSHQISKLTDIYHLCFWIHHFTSLKSHCSHTATLWVINLTKSFTASFISLSSASSLSQKLFNLSDHYILTVYQLKQFESTNHIYTSLILNDVISLAHSIIILYFISSEYHISTTDDISDCQTWVNISNSDLEYSISWFFTKSNLTTVFCWFRKEINILLQHSVFLMWISFQTTSEYSEQSDLFQTECKLHWFIASILNKKDSTVSSSSYIELFSEQTFSETQF